MIWTMIRRTTPLTLNNLPQMAQEAVAKEAVVMTAREAVALQEPPETRAHGQWRK